MNEKRKRRLARIISAWGNYFSGDTESLEKAKERARICVSCPEAVLGTILQFVPDKPLEEIQGLKCNQCQCPLSAKTREADERCPLGKW